MSDIQERTELIIIQGESWNREFYYREVSAPPKPDPMDEDPINLTGYTAAMIIKRQNTTVGESVDLTTENGGIVIDGAAGKVTCSIEDTTALSGLYVGDLFIFSPGGTAIRLCKLRFTIDESVTL